MSTHPHAALLALHDGLPRQGPGSTATTRRLLELAGPLPQRPRVLDLGCGPGRSALLLAEDTGGTVTGVDLHPGYLNEFIAAARRAGLPDRTSALCCSMDALPFPDRRFDLVWSEGAAYNLGFGPALRSWRRLLAPGATLVVTEPEWATASPSPQAERFWARNYPLRTEAANRAIAQAAGYRVLAHHVLPESDWWAEYYRPLAERVRTHDPADPAARAAAEEIALRREHGADYRYAGYVLRQDSPERTTNTMWHTRPETPADLADIRGINLAAFPTAAEADLVEALRADPDAWLDGLSMLATDDRGTVAGHALLSRCRVGGEPALVLGPCAVAPQWQRTGAGTAAIRAGLQAATERGENLVVVLGHADYYPRFGFTRASAFGIHTTFEVPDEALMALALDASRPVPRGPIAYPPAFGV